MAYTLDIETGRPQMTIKKTIKWQIVTALAKGDMQTACALFNGCDDDVIFDDLLRSFPSLMNYDAKGNYCGNVDNENGWTS